MADWFGGNKGNEANNPTPPETALRVQSSMQGGARPIVWGQARLAPNLIWYNGFLATAIIHDAAAGGGKGGLFGGAEQQATVSYTYSVSVAFGICEGPIESLEQCWQSKSIGTAAGFGFTTFVGDYAQSPWGYLSVSYPDEALAYRGLAYAAEANLGLGSTPTLPNYSYEVRSVFNDAIAGLPDADPRDVAIDFLTNAYYGVGFPTARVDPLMTQYSNYCRANGMVVSIALTEQREASAFLADLGAATNSSPRWSSGLLTIIPWGDATITANGVTYTPSITPVYDITDDDLLPSGDGDPIRVHRRKKSEQLNSIRLEYLDRENNYDPVAIEAKDQASIDAYGLRSSSLRQAHCFADADAAQQSAMLQLNREQVAVEYRFRLGPKFILPDVEDLLTLTRAALSLSRQPVRITEIQENADGSIDFTAEEFLGTASAPLYGAQASAGNLTNTNVDPGDINTPILFEPTDELAAGTLQIWGAVSGVDTTIWGGCNVYVSYDGITYQKQPGQVLGPARMGTLTAALPAFTENPTGQTVDTTNTLAVDIASSGSELTSGTQDDAAALNTLCYVDGEYIAYQTATLTGVGEYDLDYLVRGAYGTEAQMEAGAHPIGSAFARLDAGIFKVPYDQSRIGATIYIKFQSFNVYGGGLQDISALSPVTYVIQGTALASPLPDVTDLRTVFVDGFQNITWTEVTDFRAVRYEIRLGDSPDSALSLGTVAHPPFVIPGNGTYWVAAVSQPIAGLTVYSDDWTEIIITGATLINNVIATWNEGDTGWGGSFTGGAGVDLSGNSIRTGGSGDILSIADYLAEPDILNFGGNQSGAYFIPEAHQVDCGYVARPAISVKYLPTGSPVGQDILTVADILALPDYLGAASTRFINVFPQIRWAYTGKPVADLDWTEWQNFTPGVYEGQTFDFNMQLQTVDPQTIAYDLEFEFSVDVPDRIDYVTALAVDAAGTTIAFRPTGAAIDAPFNGGPDGAIVPNVQITITGAVDGDQAIITGETLAGLTIQIMNAGVGVARTVNLVIIGY